MKAYKIWHDIKYFISKDTTDELNVKWTEDANEAYEVRNYGEAVMFFFCKLRFNLNLSKSDPLYLLK